MLSVCIRWVVNAAIFIEFESLSHHHHHCQRQRQRQHTHPHKHKHKRHVNITIIITVSTYFSTSARATGHFFKAQNQRLQFNSV